MHIPDKSPPVSIVMEREEIDVLSLNIVVTPDEDVSSFFQKNALSTEYEYHDIGELVDERPSKSDLEKYVGCGEIKLPRFLPKDFFNRPFTSLIGVDTTKKSEIVPRGWPMWSLSKKPIYCLPCCFLLPPT